MNDKLKSLGNVLLVIGAITISLVLPFVFFRSALWMVQAVLPWVLAIGWIVLAIDIVIALPMAAFRRLREWSAVLLLFSSYVFGLATWLYGFAFTYALWGGVAVAFGVFMMGIGVVPMALLATMFKGMWDAFGTMLGLATLTFGVRAFSLWLGRAPAQTNEYVVD